MEHFFRLRGLGISTVRKFLRLTDDRGLLSFGIRQKLGTLPWAGERAWSDNRMVGAQAVLTFEHQPEPAFPSCVVSTPMGHGPWVFRQFPTAASMVEYGVLCCMEK